MSARPEIAEWASGLEMDFALCRDLLHAWVPHDAYFDENKREYRRVLRCARCRTERRSWVTMQGIQHGTSYGYREGYRAPEGTGFLSREERGAVRIRAMGI